MISPNPQNSKILAAVSGGADSVAMLYKLRDDGYTMSVAHFNHGVRDTSKRDQEFVAALCEKLNVPFICGYGNFSKTESGFENKARAARYEFFERARLEYNLDLIATAHTADDNLETILLNLIRGSGLRGLCGIPPKRGNIIRPLLNTTRAEIELELSERGIAYCTDETNADINYRRNYIRHEVIPHLKALNPEILKASTRLIANLSDDEEYLDGLAEAELTLRTADGFPAKELLGLPLPLAKRICRKLFLEKSKYPPEFLHIENMLDIAKGANGRRRTLCGGLSVMKQGGKIFIEPTKDRRKK